MEAQIERLGRDGVGLGADGRRAPFTLPGEVVRGEFADGELRIVDVLHPSPARVTPPCAHFGVCGGCALQHASDRFLAGWKRDVVLRALAARGIAAEVGGIAVSPPRSRRRAVFALRRSRGGVAVGFHARRAETLIDLHECHVVRPEIFAALPALRALGRIGATRTGEMRAVVTTSEGGLDIEIAGGKPLDLALRHEVAEIAAAHDWARLSWGGEVVALRRPPWQRMGRARVAPPPGAFLQATREGEAALVAAVRDAVGGAGRLVDLFAGCGTFALPLAERAEVLAVESDPAMLAALEGAWRVAAGLKRVRTETRDLFRRPLVACELKDFEAAVIDPPRAGAEAQCRELARSGLAAIAAVSCNPVSFARDAAILIGGGFRLDRLRIVDQFRWSGHVELAARFSR